MSIPRNLRRRFEMREDFCKNRNRKLAEISNVELLNAIMLMNLQGGDVLQYMCKKTTRTIKI